MSGTTRPGDGATPLKSLFLLLFHATSYVDRHIIAIALPAIGAEFLLNDAQLGILSGVAFSLFFGAAVVPAGIVTAKMDQRHVLFGSAFVWSAATALSAAATGFWSLFSARIAVGVSEASGLPTAHRNVSEHGDEVRAFARFNAGASIGIAAALLGGGVLVQMFGWRIAFICAALPGLILAPFAYLLFEKKNAVNVHGLAAFKETGRRIFQDRFRRLTYLGALLTSIIGFGMLTWLPTFLIRVHGVSSQNTGLYLAVTIGILGTLATIGGGRIASRLGQRNPAWIIWFPLVLLLIGKPLIAAALFVNDARLAMALLVFPLMFAALHFSTTLAVLHQGHPGPIRHLISTHLLMASNLVGYALGPLIVGLASWLLGLWAPDQDNLGGAIFVLQLLSAFGLYFYWRAGHALSERRVP